MNNLLEFCGDQNPNTRYLQAYPMIEQLYAFYLLCWAEKPGTKVLKCVLVK